MDAFMVKSNSLSQSCREGREVQNVKTGRRETSLRCCWAFHVQASSWLYSAESCSAQASLPARRARRHTTFAGKACSDSVRDRAELAHGCSQVYACVLRFFPNRSLSWSERENVDHRKRPSGASKLQN